MRSDDHIPDSKHGTCGKCLKEGPLFYAPCPDPRRTQGPIGMYHCPECGIMVVAGLPHPMLCEECIDKIHRTRVEVRKLATGEED